MKKLIILILVLASLSLPLLADTHDISLFFGPGTKNFTEPGINVTYGMNLGLTKQLEGSVWGMSSLTPDFFGENVLGLELGYSLKARSYGNDIAGTGINTIISGGILCSVNNEEGYFMPTDVFLALTPVTIGSPITERRERCFKIGVAYNWWENEFSVFCNVVLMDFFVRGSWKDYR